MERSAADDKLTGPGGEGSKAERDDDDEDVEVCQFKLILVGDGAVGKTSIAMRFSQDTFAQTYKQTVGVDFFIRRLPFRKCATLTHLLTHPLTFWRAVRFRGEDRRRVGHLCPRSPLSLETRTPN